MSTVRVGPDHVRVVAVEVRSRVIVRMADGFMTVAVRSVTMAVNEPCPSGSPNRPCEEHDAQRNEHRPARGPKPWIYALGCEGLGCRKNQPEHQYANRVRDRDGHSEHHSLSSRATLSN